MLVSILGGLIGVVLILLSGWVYNIPIPRKRGPKLYGFFGMNLIAFIIGFGFAAAFWQ